MVKIFSVVLGYVLIGLFLNLCETSYKNKVAFQNNQNIKIIIKQLKMRSR
jgi:hypothetical protein